MMDREKVIKEFEKICGYTLRPHEFQVLNDALVLLKEQDSVEYALDVLRRNGWKDDSYGDLLKEQEAVKPKSKVRHGANAQIQHFCGNCMTLLHGKPKYCSECGRRMKWG